MQTYHITVITRRIIETGKYYNTAFFKDDLSHNYGEHHFITVAGEVGIIDLLNETAKWGGIEEINKVIETAWQNVSENPTSTLVTLIQKYAWRYFADKSPKSRSWFKEIIYDSYLNEEFKTGKELVELINKVDLNVAPVPITYTAWTNLNTAEKIKKAEEFVLHPIPGEEPIVIDDLEVSI